MVYGVLIHGDILFGLESLYPVIEEWDGRDGTTPESLTSFAASGTKTWGDRSAAGAKVFSPFSSGPSKTWSPHSSSGKEEWKRG